jgi:hypothetical protein
MGYPYDTRENEEGKPKYPHVKFLPIIPMKTLTLPLQIPIINSLNPGLRAMFILPRNLSWSNTYPTLTYILNPLRSLPKVYNVHPSNSKIKFEI